ncbi:IS3 family transposase [Nocardia rhamnosiphila]|uniref:IS3 family transposase n=1 Tax=Nocardia rhamnosiphila TaxID=426716 RepID=UPI0033CFE566
MIVGFIDEYRQVYGVESICRALSAHGVQIAPRTYRKARRRPASARDVSDARVENALRDLQNTPEAMYGRRKMTRYLRRQGYEVAFCTVDRLMRELSLNGVVRGRRQRTTIPGKDGIRAGDKLNRDFTAAAPNQVWVADFTYVSTWTGWAYVAFVFDAYSRAIVGWTASSKTTALVTKALNMAVWRRGHYGRPIEPGLIFHTDAGSQGGFNWSSQHLELGGVGQWRRRTGSRRQARFPKGRDGSGVRIGRCGPRCVRLGGLSPRGRCSGSSGV